MGSLEDASLSQVERRVVERFARRLGDALGEELHGLWLYGSRARGEPPHPDSDVDLLAITSRASWDECGEWTRLLWDAARAEGADPTAFSLHVYEPERLAQRREIRSFFIQEVDRDKVVLAGSG